eukprot:jgi/Mesvir1/10229/Mv08549-RA.1
MTHIVGFYDKRMANVTRRMAAEDWDNGQENKWVLDDGNVDQFLCSRMEEFLASHENTGAYGGEYADFAVRKMTFNDLQRWTGMAGMVLRIMEKGDEGVVVTSHYPREDAMFYMPYLSLCWNL